LLELFPRGVAAKRVEEESALVGSKSNVKGMRLAESIRILDQPYSF